MAASLTDVAKKAGVSLATASRAFSDPDRLAVTTRQRVLAAAVHLGYEAATTVAGRTFAVIVPDISNAVLASLVKAIQDQAWHGRHRMVLSDTNEELPREREQMLQARALDGIILCSPRLAAEEIAFLAATTPLVVINQEVRGASSILMDADQGLRQAVEHLVALGHHTLAYVPGPPASWANERRLQVITDACRTRDVELSIVGNQAASIDGGLAAAAPVVASGVTAVIAYNDLVALGLEAGMRSLGVRCPDAISIVGIDDLDIAAASEPSLTSVRVAIERSGSLALELLLARIGGKSTPGQPVHLDSQLIVRSSTATVREVVASARGD